MKAGGVRICRIGGIDVFADYSWIVIFFLLTYSMAETVFPEAHKGYDRQWYWLMGTAASLLAFVSILIHELAHSWVSVKRGVNIKSVRLFIFGGMAETASEPGDGRDEFLIALAGPAANVLLCVLFCFVFIFVMGHMSPVTTVVQWAVAANAALAFFNLMPGFPLDGGRVLRAFLWDQWDDMPRATRVVNRIGDMLAVFLMVFGLLQIILYRNLLFGIWFICVGFLMKRTLGAALRPTETVQTREQITRVKVRQIMKQNAVAVDWLVPVNQFVEEYLYRYFFTEFPVFNRNELVGVVTLENVNSVAVRLRDFKQIRDIMIPVEQIAALNPEDDAEGAFKHMVESDVDCMPVMEEGRLAGIILRRDVDNYNRIKIGLRQ